MDESEEKYYMIYGERELVDIDKDTNYLSEESKNSENSFLLKFAFFQKIFKSYKYISLKYKKIEQDIYENVKKDEYKNFNEYINYYKEIISCTKTLSSHSSTPPLLQNKLEEKNIEEETNREKPHIKISKCIKLNPYLLEKKSFIIFLIKVNGKIEENKEIWFKEFKTDKDLKEEINKTLSSHTSTPEFSVQASSSTPPLLQTLSSHSSTPEFNRTTTPPFGGSIVLQNAEMKDLDFEDAEIPKDKIEELNKTYYAGELKIFDNKESNTKGGRSLIQKNKTIKKHRSHKASGKS